MDIKNTFLRSQGIKDKFDNDLFTDLQKDISNWTTTGSVSANISYNSNTKIDTLTFTSTTTPAATAQQFVDGFARLGITCSLATAQDIINKIAINNTWEGYYSTPYTLGFMIGYNNVYSDKIRINIMPYYIGLLTQYNVYFDTHPNIPKYTRLQYSKNNGSAISFQHFYEFDTTTNTIGSWYKSITGGNATEVYNNMKALYLPIYTVVDKDYTLNFAVEANKKYVLQLNQLTSTGYDKDSSIHDITLTNDTDTYTIDFNNTISQEYSKSNIIFTPTVAACTLKLNLRGMKGSGVDLKLKDISLYELQ